MVALSIFWRFLIATIASAAAGVAIFLCIRLTNASSSIFFSIIAGIAVFVAFLASPNLQLTAGLRRLWLFDWIVAALVPVPLVLAAMQETWFVKVVRYLVLFVFLISSSVVFRRFLRGRGKANGNVPRK
ncbi:hypothetical protein [Sulfurimicrobium lacus]|uniref:hypothetical protein n=1 Tax=Sulfurimicrobium lacus TaxID=2715678 RepID=UPI00156364CA|nr:hypothetical protein [Sulfurimicrobium lacus]